MKISLKSIFSLVVGCPACCSNRVWIIFWTMRWNQDAWRLCSGGVGKFSGRKERHTTIYQLLPVNVSQSSSGRGRTMFWRENLSSLLLLDLAGMTSWKSFGRVWTNVLAERLQRRLHLLTMSNGPLAESVQSEWWSECETPNTSTCC